jgi:serine/threonine-protein kinase RsbW
MITALGNLNVLEIHTLVDMQKGINRILAEMKALGYGERDIFGVRLSLEEAIVNSIRHGHRGDVSKSVLLRYLLDDHNLIIEIKDQGRGFDPDILPNPTAPENRETPGGRGVFLYRHYMTWVAFNEKGNCVTFCKKRSCADCTPVEPRP